MKAKWIFISMILLPLGLIAGNLPIRGELYEIKYNPSEKGILSVSGPITLVYVFDYWGTRGTYSGGAEALYQNVLTPDSGRARSAEMEKIDNHWVATIKIPKKAALLSYYFTDGKAIEDNNLKTYVSYIYGQDGKPVRSARFRNLDFLVMAGKSKAEQVSELKKEMADYPDNFQAYIPFWHMKFNAARGLSELLAYRSDFEKQFSDLKSEYAESDSLLHAQVSVYYDILLVLGKMFMKERNTISDTMMPMIERIPEEKRSKWIQDFYTHMKTRRKNQKIIAHIKGKPAPDFTFTTLKQKKHKLSDYKGKIVLLDFWGTWCGPCVAEIPNLAKTYAAYHAKGFEIISISSDKRVKKNFNIHEFKKFIEDNGMRWNQVVDDENLPIHAKYGVMKWPTLFLINREGVTVRVDEGLRGESLMTTILRMLK